MYIESTHKGIMHHSPAIILLMRGALDTHVSSYFKNAHLGKGKVLGTVIMVGERGEGGGCTSQGIVTV